MGSGFLRKLCTSAHMGGQVLMSEGKTCSLRMSFTTLLTTERKTQVPKAQHLVTIYSKCLHRRAKLAHVASHLPVARCSLPPPPACFSSFWLNACWRVRAKTSTLSPPFGGCAKGER